MSVSPAKEYIEELFAESHKQELEQEENLFRSLPFVVAALTLSVTMVTASIGVLFPIIGSSSDTTNTLLFVATAMGACVLSGLGMVMFHLFAATSPRIQVRPPAENELLAWEEEVRAYLRGLGRRGDGLEEAVARELRKLMIERYAAAAVHNRARNAEMLAARAQAVRWLLWVVVAAIVFAAFTISYRGVSLYHPRTEVPDDGATPQKDGVGLGGDSGGGEAGIVSPSGRGDEELRLDLQRMFIAP